jgi:hypothetical protein
MTSAVESLALFRVRAVQVGITEADIDTLKAQNLATYGAFAFLAPYNANSTDINQLKEALTGILGSEPSTAGMALWRRLQFDAHTHVLSDAKARIDRTESTEPRKIPMPEKSARLEDQKRRLSHLHITSDLEPSHALIDEVAQMMDDGVIKHISPDKCTSRRQEMGHVKKETAVKIDSSGNFKLTSASSSAGADTSTSLLLRTAFQRRSLAFDQCRLVTYVEHEKWINHIFAQLNHVPPPGYAPVSIEQVLQADLELWTLLSDECRNGISLTTAGVLPVEQAIIRLMHSPQITYAMLPLPTGRGAKAQNGKRKKEAEDDDRPDKRSRTDKGAGKGGQKGTMGRGKGDGKLSRTQVSKKAADIFESIPDLKGMWSTVRGKPLCARYQLGTCPEEPIVRPGDTCTKGLHACCVPKCFEKHSFKDHK